MNIIELHMSPGKSTPREQRVVNSTSFILFLNKFISLEVLSERWLSLNDSLEIRAYSS